jgi:uncharacterized membrane protein
MRDANPKTFLRWFKLPRVFVALSLTFGLAMVIVTPPFQAPDEPHHFFRAYQISEGRLAPNWPDNVGQGDLPVSLGQICEPFSDVRYSTAITSFSAIRDVLKIPLKPRIRENYVLATAHYSPIGYLPQAIGIWFGRILNWPPLILMYLGRITNLCVWIGLGYRALRTAGGLARPFLLLLLMPMSLFMSASLSADAVVNGLAILLVALAVSAAGMKGGDDSFVGWHWMVEYVLCASVLALAKAAYLPLAGLIFLVPTKRIGGRGRFAIILTVLALATTIPVILWSRTTPGLNMVTYLGNPHVSARRQFQFLLENPRALLLIPILSGQKDGLKMILSLVGRLGWFNIQVSPFFVAVYLLALLLACRPGVGSPVFRKPWRAVVVSAVVAAASAEALLLMIDLIWNAVGGLVVIGLQGRYFIPIAPALLLITAALWEFLPAKLRSHRSESQRDLSTALIAFAGCAYALIVLYFHYFVSVGVGAV